SWRCAGAALRPGSGTAAGPPPPPGNGTAPLEAAAGFTGKMFWQVGHLMRAPPAGIFLSSIFRFALQEGHVALMAADATSMLATVHSYVVRPFFFDGPQGLHRHSGLQRRGHSPVRCGRAYGGPEKTRARLRGD